MRSAVTTTSGITKDPRGAFVAGVCARQKEFEPANITSMAPTTIPFDVFLIYLPILLILGSCKTAMAIILD